MCGREQAGLFHFNGIQWTDADAVTAADTHLEGEYHRAVEGLFLDHDSFYAGFGGEAEPRPGTAYLRFAQFEQYVRFRFRQYSTPSDGFATLCNKSVNRLGNIPVSTMTLVYNKNTKIILLLKTVRLNCFYVGADQFRFPANRHSPRHFSGRGEVSFPQGDSGFGLLFSPCFSPYKELYYYLQLKR